MNKTPGLRRFSSLVRRRARRRDEHGYIMVCTALFIAVLVIMASFAVDVSSWYGRTTDVQRAADAAALAGVVFMPDLTSATTAATASLTKNGFVNGSNGITVTVAPVTGYPRQLAVTVTDAKVTQYFSKAYSSSPTISKKAVAEYIQQVPLGSPTNRLGNDPTVTGGTDNLWASISAPYADKDNGDPFMTKCGGGSSGTSCTQSNAAAGGEYRNTGYLYAIDITSAQVGKAVSIQLYDAENDARSSFPNVETADYLTVNTQYELFNIDNTPVTDSDNVVSTNSLSGKCTSGPGKVYIADGANSTYENKWWNLCTITPTKAGHYVLQVKTGTIPGVTDAGTGFNQYSLKATVSSGTNPAVYGIGDLSLFNNLPNNALTNTSATFYLAQIGTENQGKQLEVKLYDPGDGTSGDYTVKLLAPNSTGTAWSTTTCKFGTAATANSTVTYGSSATCAIQSRVDSNPTPNKYNGKWLSILMDINYGTTPACGTCWWKVEYDFNNMGTGTKTDPYVSPYDRTVWSAQVLGDPVHIVS